MAVCWGLNESGRASPPEGETFASISSGGAHTCGLREDGVAVCWGFDAFGQASPPEGDTFASISSGFGYSCGLWVDGAAVCWGNYREGQASPPEGENLRVCQQRGVPYLRVTGRRRGGVLGP